MNKAKKFIRYNFIEIYFIFTSILIEIVGVWATDKCLYIKSPTIGLLLLAIITSGALLINKNVVRYLFCSVFLFIQLLLNLAFVLVFNMTETYFDFGMLKLRKDAMGILEGIPMDFVPFFIFIVAFVFYIIFSRRFARHTPNREKNRKRNITGIVGMVGFAGILLTLLIVTNYDTKKIDYTQKLYDDFSGKYTQYGMTGNLVNEFAKGIIGERGTIETTDNVDGFLYDKLSEQTKYFGVSEDNNVIVILGESFEWFSFINSEEYPNGLHLSEEQISKLFPNLTRFYNEGVVMSNFHAREKTDIAECKSIIGSYPTEAYINYDFPNNEMPFTLPNIVKTLETDEISVNSFHNGFGSFYNRDKAHKAFGFTSFTDCNDMYAIAKNALEKGLRDKITMHDYPSQSERNLDSEMVDTCKDLMFPTDKRFYTYITSITMHGVYYERKNLEQHYNKMEQLGVLQGLEGEQEITYRNYVAATMELDKAIGIIFDELESRKLLDKTTIVLFGDHNSYYQGLSGYVKNIDNYNTDKNYTDLYKVPLMIYDKNIQHTVIDKFTCTSDIVPTIADLLGIKLYSNMYYGNSVFSEKESVLYSRAYDVFITDKLLLRNLNAILYKSESADDEYMKDFEERTVELLKKIEYCDKIFYNNYFAKEDKYEEYISKIKAINE